jgi:hypothetical protein
MESMKKQIVVGLNAHKNRQKVLVKMGIVRSWGDEVLFLGVEIEC